MQGRCLKDTQVSASDQIYISEEYSGFTVGNTLVQTIVATQVRNGGGGRNGRFDICVEVELTELKGEGGIKNVPQVCGLCNWISAYAIFCDREYLEEGQGLRGRRRRDIKVLDLL